MDMAVENCGNFLQAPISIFIGFCFYVFDSAMIDYHGRRQYLIYRHVLANSLMP